MIFLPSNEREIEATVSRERRSNSRCAIASQIPIVEIGVRFITFFVIALPAWSINWWTENEGPQHAPNKNEKSMRFRRNRNCHDAIDNSRKKKIYLRNKFLRLDDANENFSLFSTLFIANMMNAKNLYVKKKKKTWKIAQKKFNVDNYFGDVRM